MPRTGRRPADGDQLLDRLRGLPISTWAYTHTPEARHLGPMTQDFHVIAAQQRQIDELEARLSRVEERLE